MKKILVRIVASLLVLAIVGVLTLLFAMRGSLPGLDGEYAVAGLSAEAFIERDADGIPVIRASNRADLAFATGFAHGQDRFFQMDLIRRQSAGELSELIGAATIDADKRSRLHRFRTRAKAVVASSKAEDRAILERYADGVNAGLRSLGTRPFEYLLLQVEPQAWRAEDSVLAVYTMFMQLNDSRASRETQRGMVASVLPAQVFDWMYPAGSTWDAPIVGEVMPSAALPPADVFSLSTRTFAATAANERGLTPTPGSNNWAVAGKLTKSGRAMVSNDMHLGLDTPNIYYRARLVVEGDEPLDVAGVTLPGAPFVVAGSNTQVAWAYTNSQGDYTDAVLLQPGKTENTYRTPEGDLEFESFIEEIVVKGEDPVRYEVRETIWGPVVDDVDYPDGEIAVSWIAHKTDAVNLNIMRLEHVANVNEALDVANSMGMPPQNFVTGDAGGNIAWTIAGKIPRKTEFDARLPADWSLVSGWTGWVSSADYPRVVNPESGRIWTANTRVVDGEFLKTLGDGGYALGARGAQIRDALLAKETFTPTDMLAIQIDDRALFLAPWRDVLLEVLSDDAVGDDEQLLLYRQLVRDWLPRAAPESVGYRLVRAFRLEVQSRFFQALTSAVRDRYGEDVPLRISRQFEGPLWSAIEQRPAHLLPAEFQSWNEFLLAAVQQNIDYFNENFEGPLSARTWGEANTAAIGHPLSRAVPRLSPYLDMPRDPLHGDVHMPLAQGPSFGASERFTVAPGDEQNALLQMPTGQSGHPLSDFYQAGHEDWVEGNVSPFLPGSAVHTLTLTPRSR